MIPFNKPVWLGSELDRIAEAVRDNAHVAGDGPFGRRCETILRGLMGQTTLLATSCTHALEMAALLTGVGEGDEVIVPAYTFVSTANAFALRGARIVFADVDANGNVLPADVARLRGRRTRVVVPVHYAGNSCDMEALLAAAGDAVVVEDAAQAIGARFDGKPLGTLGALGVLSFHETKNVGCGEGGALTLRDERFLERAEVLREKGTNRRRFQQGLVDKYTWVDVGSSWVLSDLNAAYLLDQLGAADRINARRAEIWRSYDAALAAPAERAGATIIRAGRRNHPNHHLFAIVFRTAAQRGAFIDHMRRHDILTPFHYVALHLSDMGRRHHDGRPLPGAERLSSCLVRLPLFFNMSNRQVDEVIARTLEFVDGL